jgi:hypothetical protein
MKRQLPSQPLQEQFFSPATRRAPLSESIRLGAQLMLQKAVELEVTEFLGLLEHELERLRYSIAQHTPFNFHAIHVEGQPGGTRSSYQNALPNYAVCRHYPFRFFL